MFIPQRWAGTAIRFLNSGKTSQESWLRGKHRVRNSFVEVSGVTRADLKVQVIEEKRVLRSADAAVCMRC